MTRPSCNIDLLLLETGEKLILKNGFEKFSIREVCKTADVNLGMFHYFFKTKENFINLIFKNFIKRYDDIQQKYLSCNKEKKAIEKIKELLFIRAKFGRTNKEMFFSFFKDSSVMKIKHIIEKYNAGQLKMFEDLILTAQQQGNISKNISVIYALPLIFSPVNFVSFADRKIMDKYHGISETSDKDIKKVSFEDYIRKLIDIVLGGLK